MENLNVSIFENQKYELLDIVDENDFPIAAMFDIEIFLETENLAKIIHTDLSKHFVSISNFVIEKINNQNWVELYESSLPPIIFEKFYFFNETFQYPTQDNSLISIKLNSALVFGSGHHETTKACLANLIFLQKNDAEPKNILDMGAGTGILGICAKKLWPNSSLLGIDIDQEAVNVSIANYTANNIQAMARQQHNVDYLIAENKKFDLVLCNILKKPLLELCQSFSRILYTKNSYIITSGYLKNQETEIINCYKSNEYQVFNIIHIKNWSSVVFIKSKKSHFGKSL